MALGPDLCALSLAAALAAGARVVAMPIPAEPRTSAPAATPITHAHVRWWALLLVIGFCAVISTLVHLVNGSNGSDFVRLLKTITCIGIVCWTLDQCVTLLTRGRIRWLTISLITFPFGWVIGDKLSAALLGGEDFIAHWLSQPGLLWSGITASLLFAASAFLFFDRFYRAAYYRVALEAERHRAAEIERARAVSELALLQAQIEPHFLFNTLAHVLSTVEREPPVAKAMLEHLTRYLRASLQRTRESEHRLAEELELIEASLAIAAMRLGPRLRYRIAVDASLRDLRLPPMLLQPLVENAIRHGIEPAVDGGEIRVDGEQLGAELTLRVTDDGKGLAAGAPEGVGLSNVRSRLVSLYGDKGRLSLFSNSAHGVIAELRLPAQRV
jgi:Histidine kinase